jgi:hypothetical protein
MSEDRKYRGRYDHAAQWRGEGTALTALALQPPSDQL